MLAVEAGPVRASALAGYVPILGRVGANPDGVVLFATGQDAGDLAPIPPGGTEKAAALRVVVRGRVQGVGFREYVLARARFLNSQVERVQRWMRDAGSLSRLAEGGAGGWPA